MTLGRFFHILAAFWFDWSVFRDTDRLGFFRGAR